MLPFGIGAGDEARTRDLNLGKVALYQLSYSRIYYFDYSAYQPGTTKKHCELPDLTETWSGKRVMH